MEATYSSETSVEFTGLHSVTSQKIGLFIATAVRATNTTTSSFSKRALFFGVS
jgi:hypothetical protein